MIEFRCQQCGAMLRVPPGTEGKQAKCPQCSALMTIPTPAARPADPFRPAPPADPTDFSAPPPREGSFSQASSGPTSDPNNPFQSPQSAGAYPSYGPGRRGFYPSPILFGEVFERTWQVYKANLGLLLGGGFLIFVLMGIITQVVNVLFGVNADQFQVGFEVQVDNASSMLRQIAAGLVTQVINAFFFLGWITMTLKMARGENASLGDLFSVVPIYPQGAAIHVLFSLGATIGFMLCFFPGLWFALAFGLTLYMFVDQRTGIVESFQYSYRAMRGNMLTLLGLELVMLGLIVAGVIACCVGLFFTLPFCGLLMTIAYLAATGQLPSQGEPSAPYTTP